MMFDIEEELKKLPARPGVYIMHDDKDAIIYVGKAIMPEKPCAPVFSEEPEPGDQKGTDGGTDRQI